MSPVATATCPECGSPNDNRGNCVNVNCETAAKQATRRAVGDTRKSAAPAAFTASGRVD